ncbi:MAG: 4Fe-4S binding protein [Clostridiales bacterium]|nr:4Fe-4S binding protein [Clostridiales bacterium]
MVRQMIKIDEELCNGCGLCVNACHEGALEIVDGKARLMRDDYCDGLGNCLPACPTGAISFEEREAAPFDEEAVKMHMEQLNKIKNSQEEEVKQEIVSRPSMLRQWPVQIQLVPPHAPYFKDANLLIAADCTAYAYGDFHQFMKNKITIIGCPKLDDVDYSDKLSQIIMNNSIKSITVIRMEVPCCGGIVHYVKTALSRSGKMIPWRVVVLGTDGTIIEDM